MTLRQTASSGYRDITATELAAASPRPRIIDVRAPEEFNGELGHIPGAELVPLDTLEHRSRTWKKDAALVLVCRSGARSSRAAAELVAAGFTQIENLAGGTLGHVAAGLPVER